MKAHFSDFCTRSRWSLLTHQEARSWWFWCCPWCYLASLNSEFCSLCLRVNVWSITTSPQKPAGTATVLYSWQFYKPAHKVAYSFPAPTYILSKSLCCSGNRWSLSRHLDRLNDSETQKALWWVTHINSSQYQGSNFPSVAENWCRCWQIGLIPGR